MARSWVITGREIATKIKNATRLLTCKLDELVAEPWMECPNCKCHINNSEVYLQWPKLPAGVKFDPSELELLEHLQGKVSLENSESHIIIDDFIPTVKGVEGICFTHPENLPGIKMDGSSSHFFHRISNAYGCGQRKRRRISNNNYTVCDEHSTWHKTGKSKAILDNGVKKGWKKIFVLYKCFKKGGGKRDKTNWVMHQYHLGVEEDEKGGELVVSKIFYQLPSKQIDKSEMDPVDEESDPFAVKIDPRTPKTDPPQLRRPNSSPCETEHSAPILHDQEEEESGSSTVQLKAEPEDPACYAGMSQAVEDASLLDLDEHPLCNEIPDACLERTPTVDYPAMDALHGFSDLDDICLGTLPSHGTFADLHFGSQDSLNSFSWLGRMQ